MDILIATPQQQTQQRLANIAGELGMIRYAETWPQVVDAFSASCAMALIDAALLDHDLIARIHHLHSLCPPTRIARLCDEQNDAIQVETLAAGAFGTIRLSQSDETILRAIKLINNGQAWIERHLVPMLMQRLTLLRGAPPPPVQPPPPPLGKNSPAMNTLTSREKDVLCLLSAGKSNKLIARQLDITDRTVKAHLTSIYRKLGVTDRVHLILHLNEPGKA